MSSASGMNIYHNDFVSKGFGELAAEGSKESRGWAGGVVMSERFFPINNPNGANHLGFGFW